MISANYRSIRIACTLVAILASTIPGRAMGQDDSDPNSMPVVENNENGDANRQDNAVNITKREQSLNFLGLLMKGGWFMVPLAALSVIVIAITIERSLALRSRKIMPRRLIHELSQMSAHHGGFDPRVAYRICQVYPSSAARVIQAMLLKIGRPQTEVEHAVAEASQREANRLSTVVGWLTLAAAVAPLVGLLGTVWGMIHAFFDLENLNPSANKVRVLSSGIYTALVTTMCGLMIAIPAAVVAHMFENRILAWFHRIDEMLASIMPQVERYEGQVRFGNIPGDREPQQRDGNRREKDQTASDGEPSPTRQRQNPSQEAEANQSASES